MQNANAKMPTTNQLSPGQQQQQQQQLNFKATNSEYDLSESIAVTGTTAATSASGPGAAAAAGSNSTGVATVTATATTTIKRSVALNDGSNILEENEMLFYGLKSLDIVDTKLDSSLSTQVLAISFNYIDYDDHLCRAFARLRAKFANVNTLTFTCCNIAKLYQLDALAEWRRLESVTINSDDNPVCAMRVWRAYAVHQLAHLHLKRLNGETISSEDVRQGERLFQPILDNALALSTHRLGIMLGPDKYMHLQIILMLSKSQFPLI